MKILDRYIGRTVFGASLMVLLILAALSAFITFFSEFDNIGRGSYGILQALEYSLLMVPEQSLDLFPTATLIGALLGLGGLASSNELMVVRAAGVSLRRIAVSALLGGLAMALVAGLVSEFAAPPANRFANSQRSSQIHGKQGHSSTQNVWARDGDTFINVRQLVNKDLIRDIYIYRFNNQKLLSVSHADRANFEGRHWVLHDIATTHLHDLGSPDATVNVSASASHQQSAVWSTLLSPSLLRLFVVNPHNLSAAGLHQYIDYLDQNDLDAKSYRVAFWAKIVRPITVLVMVLLAIPFVFGPLRSVTNGQRILVGVLAGIAFYLVNTTVIQVGEVVGAPAIWTTCSPTALLALASLIVLTRLR